MKDEATKRLLIITFNWCPKGGIGSRRWSKFAKYLSKRGYHIDAITGKYPTQDKVNWCHDIQNNSRIVSHPTPTGYPTYLLQPRRNALIKAGSRLLQQTTHRIDYAMQWHRWMHRRCAELLKRHQYQAVIMTVGPFSPLLHFPDLSKAFPQVKFILDYRDPWSYYQSNVRGFSREELLKKEAQALKAAAAVWVTTEEHKSQYEQQFPGISEKVSVLTNGYDPEDFPNTPNVSHQNSEWVAIHPGGLTGGRFETLQVLLEALNELNDPILHKKFRIHLYTNSATPVKQFTPAIRLAYAHYVLNKGVVTPQKMYVLLKQARFGLTLDVNKHNLTIPSKTFDYLGLGISTIYLGPEGHIPDDLNNRGQYCSSINKEEIIKLLKRIRIQELNSEPIKDQPQENDPYHLDYLTDRLCRLLP